MISRGLSDFISCGRFWRPAGGLIAALLASLLAPQDEARANNVACIINSAAINMGTANNGVGTIDFTCTSLSQGNRNFDLCIALGNPSWPGTLPQPVMRGPNNARLNFNVFRDAAVSTIWTQQQPLVQRVSIPGGRGNTFSGMFRFYAATAPGQSPPPGNYNAAFFNNIIGFLSNDGQCLITGNPNLSGQQFTILISRVVSNHCTVSALGDADLGAAPATIGAISGSTTISVGCPVGTAFNIGMSPSNGNTNGAGVLQRQGGSANDSVAYQLRQGSASGPVWGNTASSSGPGNGVGGIGNGTDQTFPVFVTVPNTVAAPGKYRDTVIVTVHF